MVQWIKANVDTHTHTHRERERESLSTETFRVEMRVEYAASS